MMPHAGPLQYLNNSLQYLIPYYTNTYIPYTDEHFNLNTRYRLFTFSGRTCLRGVQGNPNKFPILVQGDAVHGIGSN